MILVGVESSLTVSPEPSVNFHGPPAAVSGVESDPQAASAATTNAAASAAPAGRRSISSKVFPPPN